MGQSMMAIADPEPSQVLPLRDYQEQALEAIAEAYDRHVTRQLVSLPTGAGKTYVAAHLARRRQQRTVFMVHRDELANQTVRQMRMVNPGLSIGICKADRDELGADIIVASAQTLVNAKRLERLTAAVGHNALFISDECHHDLAPSRRRAIDTVAPDLLVGLTATPMRGDKLGLDAVYQEIVFHLPMRTLVEQQNLKRPVGLRIETDEDLDRVRTVAGEFNERDLADTVDTDARNSLVVSSWQKHAQGERERTIAFCVTVAHAQRLRDAFREAGVTAEMVDGTTPLGEREHIFTAFSRGEVQVLTNCMVLTEGFDEPAIDCALMCRPTKSTGLYIQCVGRALRKHPGKPDALVIDFVDATTKHTLVTLPSLAGAEPRKPGEKPVQLSEASRKAGQVMDLFDALSHEGRLRERNAIMLDLLADSPFTWQQVPDGPFMAPAGQVGEWVTVIPDEDGGFVPVRISAPRGGDAGFELLLDRSVDAGTAMEVAQRCIPSSALTERDRHWRRLAPSDGQLRAAERWRVPVAKGVTRGQLSDLIDMATFRAAMKKSGLNNRRAG